MISILIIMVTLNGDPIHYQREIDFGYLSETKCLEFARRVFDRYSRMENADIHFIGCKPGVSI